MKRTFFIISIIFVAKLGFAQQNCDCESAFAWTKQTFEQNDAGFQYVLENKGQQAYDFHNKIIAEKIKNVKSLSECSDVLNEWLQFFRKGHIGLRLLVADNVKTNDDVPDFSDWETLNVDLTEFKNYLQNKKTTDYEGIWETKPYKIGIKKIKENDFVGFIVESGAATWKKNQIKLRITTENGKEKFVFYMRDHSPQEGDEIEMTGKNMLRLGNFYLQRNFPKLEENKEISDFIKTINADKPYLETLNKTTLYIRIPSFEQKKAIDRVLLANKEKILHTENLIIDLRGNGGGNDGAFDELIPFLYTNPIRTVGVDFLSTELNNKKWLNAVKIPEVAADESTVKWIMDLYERSQKNLRKFVRANQNIVETYTQATVYEFPKNAGIIIDRGCGSSTEQFLLTVKQSKKVKLFGTTTDGALDVSNLNSVKSPCEQFEMAYATSRSYRIPDFTIDDKGIQPDFYIDDEIPKYQWVEYVNKILNEK